ncbi:MAG TPA: enoyl-CoA hydratase [Acidimicrobiales bacterium]|nr:enoyl-CoA hydratase [Acidimicrobiales bacterium]
MIAAQRDGDVVVITLDRPERRNAVDADACEAIRTQVEVALAELARVVVLTGAHGHFCAGADLGGVEDHRFRSAIRACLDTLRDAPVCTIAAVSGAALGAGTQLAVACDLRVATPDARFGIPAAKLGLMVDQRTVQHLTELAGAGPARAMLLAAEQIGGKAAHGLGLVNRIGSFAEALAWAHEISQLAPLTVAGHKLAMNRLAADAADSEVAAAVDRAWSSDDLREGMAAFKEKRAAQFRGA